jgi:hypothetical protein
MPYGICHLSFSRYRENPLRPLIILVSMCAATANFAGKPASRGAFGAQGRTEAYRLRKSMAAKSDLSRLQQGLAQLARLS